MKRFVLLALTLGCASMNARHNALESAQTGSEISVVLRAPADRAHAQVLRAFMDHQLTVSSSQDRLIEAKLPREMGMLGQYDLVARAVLVPTDTTTQVTLYGEEIRIMEGAGQKGSRVSEYSRGRAGKVWKQLQDVAAQLRSP